MTEGSVRNRNGVGILVDDELMKQVVEVKRVNNRMMSIKLVIEGSSWNIINAYAPHVGLDDEEKKKFWEDLDEMVRSVPSNEKLFIGRDFNGHIGSSLKGYDDMHERHRFGVRNVEGVTFLDFGRAFGLVVVNSNFPMKEVHLVTFCSSVVKTQIDLLLLRKRDRGICKACKVLPSESLSTQHRFLVMDLRIIKERRKRGMADQLRIRWGRLTLASALDIWDKLMARKAWESGGDIDSMWDETANCIRETTREVLGVLQCLLGKHQGDWW
ncbi:craniofacial development protein 2-like [Capsicum annuum]|uniref:craniofacial development protein 2-like n=1 Tax=Capsicum annuum TaxID=4072 RepID=UPI001FB0EE6F|nr:craniofacial development protein 2-like [Capsicum annuum]